MIYESKLTELHLYASDLGFIGGRQTLCTEAMTIAQQLTEGRWDVTFDEGPCRQSFSTVENVTVRITYDGFDLYEGDERWGITYWSDLANYGPISFIRKDEDDD